MKHLFAPRLRTLLGCLLISVFAAGLGACSSHDVAERQQSISGIHQSMIDRREARQQARDERFQASRDSWLN